MNDEDFELENDDLCPEAWLAAQMMNAIPKPLGMIWEDEMVERFLTAKGYTFLHRTNSEGEEITVVYKKSDSTPVDMDRENVMSTFTRELQLSLIEKLV